MVIHHKTRVRCALKFYFAIRDISDCNTIILSGRKYLGSFYLLKAKKIQYGSCFVALSEGNINQQVWINISFATITPMTENISVFLNMVCIGRNALIHFLTPLTIFFCNDSTINV